MPSLISKKIILLIFLSVVVIIAAVMAAIAANSAKKAGNPDKYPEKRKEAATLALSGAAICFGAIVIVMLAELIKTAAKERTINKRKSVVPSVVKTIK